LTPTHGWANEEWIDESGIKRRGYTCKDTGGALWRIWGEGKIGMYVGYVDEQLFANINPDTTGMAPVPLGPTNKRGAELNSLMMGLFSGVKDPVIRDAAWEYMWWADDKAAMGIKPRVMVEGGLGSFVNPRYLEMFGYTEVIRLSPPKWAEIFQTAMDVGRPEPYGRNSSLAFGMMSAAMQEADAVARDDELPGYDLPEGMTVSDLYRAYINDPDFKHPRLDMEKRILEINAYKAALPSWCVYYFSPEGFFKALFIKNKYTTKIADYNARHGTDYASYGDLHLSRRAPTNSPQERADWEIFVRATLNLVWLRADPEAAPAYREFLRAKYLDIAALNTNYATAYASFDDIPIVDEPSSEGIALSDWDAFLQGWKDPDSGRMHLLPIDAVRVHSIDFMFRDYLGSLIVNPMAAYAMSRYKMPSTYKILLFLMLTMAFPPLVAMIPQFLMLREFNLLNTFWALVLPGLANGYMIFLLKGFFDSLPRELYESAELDGAGELRIFWQITMALSKPILAVIALQSFTLAYSNFMMALLICQDEKMWTLMVWLYQLQQKSGPGVIYASLLLAAVPTLTVFVFCQNIIMRGIVVPVEK